MTDAEPLVVVEKALCRHFGQAPVRASVSFLGVEPIEVLRFEPIPGERAYVSLGMSRRPMTAASDMVVEAEGPRAELMLHLRDPGDRFTDVWRRLALLAASPAVEGVVYTPGMTVDIGEPFVPGSRCTGGVLAESPLPPIETPGGPIQVMLIVPATSTELAWGRVQGSAGLLERWRDQGTDLLDLGRSAVSLA